MVSAQSHYGMILTVTRYPKNTAFLSKKYRV
jgi:hypothetical protein